jgi:endoglucanase
MCKKLIYLVSFALILGMISNVTGQIATNATEDFETGDFSKFPWAYSGDESWFISSTEKNSGNYSAQAGSINDNESTTLQVWLDCVSGNITFYRRVSSESDYDYLKFSIDGAEKGRWSGEQDWAQVSFPVDEGTRTFEWTYSKDGSVSNGDDAAWIDDIVFPADRTTLPAEAPFERGVNITNWFQTSSAHRIQFTKYTKQDLINIKSLGCDVIRLNINLHAMTNGQPDYTIDPLFYYFLDQIIDWTEEMEFHLILENGSSDYAVSEIANILVPLWTQMAQHYKDRSNYIYYEVLNEPHDISDTTWNQIQQQVINAIRAVDQKHTIIVGPAGYNSYNNLGFIPKYEDDNLIYTFHFYDPFVFTHQGATWIDPSMEPLAGVPFPYDAARMPECPPELKGTWIESNLNSYQTEGTVQHVKELIDIAVRFRDQRRVPVFCGEFGVYRPNCNNEDRIYWLNLVRSYLEQKGIAWTVMDYQDLFELGTSELFDHDLNIPLIEGLGLIPPPQTPYVLIPDLTGFEIYTDYVAQNMQDFSYFNRGTLDFYCDTVPVEGERCIYCTGFDLYSAIGFDFRPDKDLTVLVREGYVLDLWVRGDTPDSRLGLGFNDSKTSDPRDHPWRIAATVDESMVAWDQQWHHVQIPLKNFVETGSGDNGWFEAQGAFDWSAVDRLEISAEYHDFVGRQFWFDDIRVLSSSTSTPPRNAFHPDPPDGTQYAALDVTLYWTPGLNAKLHYVYFGENFDTVRKTAGGVPQATPTYTPIPLERGKTYYWRVDEFDGTATHRGDVWSFSTIPIIAIEDPALLGWWKLEEGYGVTAVDFSGHENHGTIHFPNGGLGQGGSAWIVDPELGVALMLALGEYPP